MSYYKRPYGVSGWNSRNEDLAMGGLASARPRRKAAQTKTGGFAGSPAGKHRRLAMNCFALAKKARAAGNSAHYWTMVKLGKQALALSKSEYFMWKKGLQLKKRSFATHSAALSKGPKTAY